MTLSPDQLNSLDRYILEFLSEHESATPSHIRAFYAEDQKDVSRQWVSDRIVRLTEHGHLRRVHPDVSTYMLVDDPRE